MADAPFPIHTPPSEALSDPAAAADWLERNASESLPAGALRERLRDASREGRPLRVKLGIDPTAADIHLGFTVVLGKLREFQELGHTVVLIIGDWTARVGDPSGRSQTRPELSAEEIESNASTFAQQASKVLRADRLEIRRNGEWLDMPLERMFSILRLTTVAQVTEREDIDRRLRDGVPVSLLELLYPVLQGYDSVAVEADVELGGTDQHFNLLLGRDLQRSFGQREQIAMELPILVGTDGERKMSKSLGNYIGVNEPAGEIFGKTMSLPDAALGQWFELLLGHGLDESLAPRDAKRRLARDLVDRFCGDGAGAEAQAEFDRRFVKGELPRDVDVFDFGRGGSEQIHLPALLAAAFGVSRSEGRRTISANGVKVDGEVVSELDLPAEALDGRIVQMGKIRACQVRIVD